MIGLVGIAIGVLISVLLTSQYASTSSQRFAHMHGTLEQCEQLAGLQDSIYAGFGRERQLKWELIELRASTLEFKVQGGLVRFKLDDPTLSEKDVLPAMLRELKEQLETKGYDL